MFQLAELGYSDIECAAWVSGVPGQYTFDPWPRTGESDAISADRPPKPGEWNVHTHPNNMIPWPSTSWDGQDRNIAEKTGKSIYTIHKSGIWKFDPRTNQTTQLLDHSWREGVDHQMVELMVSFMRARDERSGIKNRIETAQFAYSKARQSGKRKRAAWKLMMIKQALEELNLVELAVQEKLASLRNKIEGLGLDNAVAVGPGTAQS